MSKRLPILLMLLLLPVMAIFGQSVMLEPVGVSPATIKADTVGDPDYIGIYDRVYSGLLNVGVETKMFLMGSSDMQLTSGDWSVLEAPDGSAATFMNETVVDTSTEMATFTPDLVGTYVLEFADGGAAATVTVNSAKYLGVGEEDGCTNAFCHKDQTAEWRMTDHATMFKRGLNGTASSHYGERCISCHTTGYDTLAMNDGFDDFDFVFPTELKEGMYDSLMAEYPDAMRRGNIQCEACHGPASAHNGATDDNKMVSSLATSACATCHDDDHYHVYPSQWEMAGHSELPPYPGGSRTDCEGCHNGAQFIQFAEGEEITKQPTTAVTCAVCHDPHMSFGDTPEADNGRFQIRTIKATLANGQMVEAAGNGALCINCHQNRRDANTYTNSPRAHYGPHYAPQGDMLIGTNAVTFGKKLPTSPHMAATENACVDCHMFEGSDGHATAGMHSFSMVSPDGHDNVESCVDCHGDVGESFDEKMFYMNGKADHDGDGVDEGLQDEIHGMMDKLGAMLPSDDPHADVDSTWTRTELKAAFNHRLVYYDHSYGIHNPAWTVSVLNVTMQALMNNAIEGEIVAVDDVPNDQGRHVKIIWDKFVDDGVATDPVKQYLVKRYDAYDDTWTGVGQHPADGSMRYALVVPTVFDSTGAGDGMTTFMVEALTAGGVVHKSMPADGYSVDNLIPHAPMNVKALLADHDVDITWEAPMDPDVNYYEVHRSTTEGFTPDENSLISTVTDVAYTDAQVDDGTYYYKVVAVDFSGNIGVPSLEVTANVTAIGDDMTAPLEYKLAQNYPNPFNPSTTINFSLKKAGKVTLTVYDALGKQVQVLVDKQLGAGTYSASFNGNGMSSGVYFYRVRVTENGSITFQDMNKMILMK